MWKTSGAARLRAPHVLPAPLNDKNYENAKLVLITKDTVALSPGFTWLDPRSDAFGKRWSGCLTTLHKATRPERYDGTAFYPAAILLLGDLVK